MDDSLEKPYGSSRGRKVSSRRLNLDPSGPSAFFEGVITGKEIFSTTKKTVDMIHDEFADPTNALKPSGPDQERGLTNLDQLI